MLPAKVCIDARDKLVEQRSDMVGPGGVKGQDEVLSGGLESSLWTDTSFWYPPAGTQLSVSKDFSASATRRSTA
jgi:hypothetical protein